MKPFRCERCGKEHDDLTYSDTPWGSMILCPKCREKNERLYRLVGSYYNYRAFGY